jgi:hypothetical protein
MRMRHRILTLHMVAALIAAMMVMSTLPTFAQGSGDVGSSQEAATTLGNDIFVQTAQVWCALLGGC